MKVYISHSREFDYVEQLYQPIRLSPLNFKHEFILPHEDGKTINSKDTIISADIIIAEVSYPSTGQGIELALAEAAKIPVYCFYKEGVKISGSLNSVTKDLVAYKDKEDLINKIITLMQ